MSRDSESVLHVKQFLASGVSAAIAQTTVAPIERVKILLQTQAKSKATSGSAPYKNAIDAFVRIPKEQGFLSLWRGNLACVIRYFPTQALNFTFKDTYRQYFIGGVDRNTNFWPYFAGNLAAGATAGFTSSFFIYPLDLVRTRLAIDVGKKGNREFKGIIDCLKKILMHDGVVGVYRGFTVSLQGVIIYRGLYFGIYDTSRSNFSDQSIFMRFLMALTAATTSTTVVFPLDTVRRRMMMQSGQPKSEWKYKSITNCYATIWKEENLRGFYRGVFPNVFQATGGAIVLVLYDVFMSKIQ